MMTADERLGVVVGVERAGPVTGVLAHLGHAADVSDPRAELTRQLAGDDPAVVAFTADEDGVTVVAEVAGPRRDRAPTAPGPIAVGYYASDEGVVAASTARSDPGPTATVGRGQGAVHEAAIDLDDVTVVLQRSARRLPSRLDHGAARGSGVHVVVWAVPDVEAVLEDWRALGLRVHVHARTDLPDVGRMLGLVEPQEVEFAILGIPGVPGARLELVGFPEAEAWALDVTGGWRDGSLHPGDVRLLVSSSRPPVDGLDVVRHVVHGDARAWLLAGPGGVAVEWHQTMRTSDGDGSGS